MNFLFKIRKKTISIPDLYHLYEKLLYGSEQIETDFKIEVKMKKILIFLCAAVIALATSGFVYAEMMKILNNDDFGRDFKSVSKMNEALIVKDVTDIDTVDNDAEIKKNIYQSPFPIPRAFSLLGQSIIFLISFSFFCSFMTGIIRKIIKINNSKTVPQPFR